MKLLKLIGNILALPLEATTIILGVLMTILKFPIVLLKGKAYFIKVKWKFLKSGIKRIWNNAKNHIDTDIVSTIEIRDDNGTYTYERINGHRLIVQYTYTDEEENIGEGKECNTQHS